MREIANYGRDGFYNGWVAEDIVKNFNLLEETILLNDFSNLNVEYVEPISSVYRGYDVFECPPNGQGIVALMILNILQNLTFLLWKPIL